jgi:diguanylate cyclase (GGDEF)-like protein
MALIAFLLTTSGRLITNTFELVTLEEGQTIFWAKTTYIFLSSGVVTWLIFALRYAGVERVKRHHYFILSIVPIISVLVVFTNEFHSLVWQKIDFQQGNLYLAMRVEYGPWFWIFSAYSYILILLGAYFIAAKYIQSFKVFRRQSTAVIIGMILPLATNIIYIFKIIPGFQKDYSPISFALAGIFFAYGILRSGSIHLNPVALNTVINHIADGLIVLDHNEQIISTNPAALEILDSSSEEVFGQPIGRFPQIWQDPIYLVDGGKPFQFEIAQDFAGGRRCFEVKITSLALRRNRVAGHIIILHEVTERVQLLGRLHELATMDPLTEISNRRHFFDLASKEFNRAHRYHRDLSFVMFDIDKFKSVNDQYGHLIGDQVLKELVQTCKESLRDTDIFARYGGEEFIILLPETDTDKASQTAERLREKVEGLSVIAGADTVSTTISLGVSSLTDEGDITLDKLLERADKAMYEAKRKGRNQSVSWGV